MTFIYALVFASVTNLSDVNTIRYFSNYSDCMQEKYRYEENKDSPYIYDCWVIQIKENG